MKPSISILIIALTLSGCGIHARQREAAEEAQRERNEQLVRVQWQIDAITEKCAEQYKQSKKKSQAQEIRCWQEPVVNLYQQAGVPNIDLIKLNYAKKLELAEKVDKKKITEAEAESQLAQFEVWEASETRQRDYQAQSLQNQKALIQAQSDASSQNEAQSLANSIMPAHMPVTNFSNNPAQIGYQQGLEQGYAAGQSSGRMNLCCSR